MHIFLLPESAPNGGSQPLPSCFTTTAVPSPSKPRASELVLQRMKKFKRADPERLRHASEDSSLKTTLEENVPRSPQAETVAENGMVSVFCFLRQDCKKGRQKEPSGFISVHRFPVCLSHPSLELAEERMSL